MTWIIIPVLGMVAAALWLGSIWEALMFWGFRERYYRIGPQVAIISGSLVQQDRERLDKWLTGIQGYRTIRVSDDKWLVRQRLYLGALGDARLQILVNAGRTPVTLTLEARHALVWPIFLVYGVSLASGLFLWAHLAGADAADAWLRWLVMVVCPVLAGVWLWGSVAICRGRARRVWQAIESHLNGAGVT
jgi:hypothetical protein